MPVFSALACSVFISVFLIGISPASAQTTTASQTPAPIPGTVVIATVNIQDAKIVSQEGNTFQLSFSLSNREIRQTGVKYGVQLVSQTKTSSVVVDEKVYPDVLTLEEHSSISKDVTYVAPQNLSGSYMLLIVSKNESGLPYGIAFVSNVTLVATGKGVVIDTGSCFLTVPGEKGSPHYNLTQGVDILANEHLALSCSVTNQTTSAVTLTPSFETRYRSVYGQVVPATGGDTSPVTLAAGEKKTVLVNLPRTTDPQAYDVIMTLASGTLSSNAAVSHYVVRGASATIQNLSLDKDRYRSGDAAQVEFVWAPSADDFAGARYGTTTPATFSARMTLVDGAGAACAAPAQQTLGQDMKVAVPLALTKECTDPKVTLTITDGTGTVLAERTLALISSKPAGIFGPAVFIGAFIVGLLGVAGIGGYLLRKKNSAISPSLS